VLGYIRSDKRLAKTPARLCDTERTTFHQKVLLRREIVTLGAHHIGQQPKREVRPAKND